MRWEVDSGSKAICAMERWKRVRWKCPRMVRVMILLDQHLRNILGFEPGGDLGLWNWVLVGRWYDKRKTSNKYETASGQFLLEINRVGPHSNSISRSDCPLLSFHYHCSHLRLPGSVLHCSQTVLWQSVLAGLLIHSEEKFLAACEN